MKPKKPPPLFEVRFEGPAIYPEKIPLRSLMTTLSAVQRLAAGTAPLDDDDDDGQKEGEEEESLRLLEVKRGSAVFQIGAPSSSDSTSALQRLKVIGDFLENQADDVENIDYALSPIRDLSATARSLDCTIALREVGHKNRILGALPIDILRIHFEIAPGRRRNVFRWNGSKGRGATAVKCGLRVGFQHRMLICRVPEKDVARTIGKRLYEDVVVHGTANWLKKILEDDLIHHQERQPTESGVYTRGIRRASGRRRQELGCDQRSNRLPEGGRRGKVSVALDTMILIWGGLRRTNPQKGKLSDHDVEMQRRSRILLRDLDDKKEIVIVPAVAVV